MKTIIRAPHSGFCFGVKQAIEKAEEAAIQCEGKPIHSRGSLIHNKNVTEQLRLKGIDVIETLDQAKENETVIVRSHGEPKSFYEEAGTLNLSIVDATCPYVKRIHDHVQRAHQLGKQVVIVGDRNHPEVIGVNGWCENSAIVVANADEAETVKGENLFVVAQTTIQKETLDEVTRVFEKNGVAAEIENTICKATTERQKGCEETAKQVDLMLIVGDHTSSNTKKLFEIAQKYCPETYFVENINDLPLKKIQKYNKIGVAAGASTPESAIEEVISKMSDKITDNNELSMNDFMDYIEKSIRLPRGGEMVTGTIHQVTDREIIVNLGCKKDGIIPKEEIKMEPDQKLTDLFHVGDEIHAKVIKTDDGDGSILLSRKKLEAVEHWDEINNAYENRTLIDVNVLRQVNGGVIAAYKEVQGFIPLSQLSDKFVEDSAEFVGRTLSVRVSRVDQRRGKAVFSRKAHLQEEKQKLMEEIWNTIEVGDIVEGAVMRFTDYGAFVDIGGIDGLLHISEISWGKLKHPQEVLKIGQTIQVKVLSMNSEKGKISLGLKQTQPEPWAVIDDKYQVGDVVEGKVVQIKEYGCFVELEPGLDGLVHISEVNHKRIGNINDEFSVGDTVKAKILEIDKENKRISLSIKETIEPPIFEEEVAPAAEAPVEAEAAPEVTPEAVAEVEAAPEVVEETEPEVVEEAAPEVAEEAAPEVAEEAAEEEKA
jgi:(E)-4-hydroxy-3-methyl-but-2-enyl pyrophosphate reductase